MSNVARVREFVPTARQNQLRRLTATTAEGRSLSGLQGSYSLIGGTVDTQAGGPFTDRSGTGHNATLVLGSSPWQRAGGLEADDADGMVFNSGINLTNNALCVMSLKITADNDPTTYPVIFSPSGNGFPAAKEDAFGNEPHPFAQAWMQVAHERDNTYGFVQDSAVQVPGRPTLPAANAPANEWCTIAIRIYGSLSSQGVMELWSLKTDPWSREGGYVKIRDADLNNYYGGFSAQTWYFGIWPYGTLRPATGILGLVDIYNTLVQTETVFEIMRAQAREMYGRGVSVQGYPYKKF